MADWLGKLKDKFTPYAVVASRVAEKKAELVSSKISQTENIDNQIKSLDSLISK